MYTQAKALERARKGYDLIEAGWAHGAMPTMGGYVPCWFKGDFRLEYNSFQKTYVCHYDRDRDMRQQSSSCKEWRDAVESLRMRFCLSRNLIQDLIDAIEQVQS
jgi:hypothetical protein